MGKSLLKSSRFKLISLFRFHYLKEKMCGCKQSEIIRNGIAQIIKRPVIKNNAIRKVFY